ncbi:DNA repair metallo-beta-lactamase-domain-containing protein [Naematelia encephala]|uniref:DNA repair metallo-beta-lactamase-domain-containing protein n=1 Tax=Naematelia encephala TaxID=71784 RepID=A0A1Y2BJC6_9TREE|nr:DNA repair metallo-beta-lactamase-domain-containing protein [Naematelia encephala]
MVKTTSKKRETPKKKESILSFFQKSQATPGRKSGNEDIKPDVLASVSNTEDKHKRTKKGKGRETDIDDVYGSSNDPVVISDDDEAIVRSPPPLQTHASNGQKRRRLSASVATSHEDIIQIYSSPIAGPSKSPPGSCSPPPPQPTVFHLPPPVAGLPDFRPPPTWPQIVNTADGEGIDDEEGEEEEDAIPPSDPEDGRDDGDETQDPEDGRDDGDTQDPRDDGDDSQLDVPGLGMELEIDEPQLLPDPPPSKFIGGVLPMPVDIDMEWDEGNDEGMGMEEEGDDEASEIVQTPPPRRGNAGSGKVTTCPICGISLRGKVNTLVQHHINNCLDTPSTSTVPKGRVNRPISSFNHTMSPAPSSPSPPPEEQSRGPNAFSVLMNGHKEREQWKDAEVDLKRDGKRVFGRRKAPFYKVLTGMPVAVDAFRYGAIPKVTAYLLTHAHSDHYTNLSKSWTHGPIYCSKTTANLIIHMLGVEPKWVHGLPDDVPFEMPNTGGVKVTPIEANHCPGSSIFLFEGPQTVNAGDSGFKSPYVGSKRVFRYLHCGDFRACPKMVLHPDIARAKIDTCYLDTTYLNPKYCFPPQPQVIDACAALARRTAVGIPSEAPPLKNVKPDIKPDLDVYGDLDVKPDTTKDMYAAEADGQERAKAMMQGWLVKKDSEEDLKDGLVDIKDQKPKGRTLIVMGTYSIGKERIVQAVAKAIASKIYCDPRKRSILLCQTDPELHALLTDDPLDAQVHLLPLGNISLDSLQPYLHRLSPHFDRVLGFRPTGWTYTPPAGTDLMPDVNMVIRRDQSRWFGEAGLKPMRGSCRQFMMYGVPYSEHSSFFELTCFALSLPGPDLKMIATVNVGNEKSRAKMKKWFEKWSAEKARRKEKNLPAVVDYRHVTYW